MKNIVDITKYSPQKSDMLSGREIGKNACLELKIMELLNDNTNTIEIHIADRIRTMSISFFLGMFEKAVIDLGEDEFRKRVIFVSSNNRIYVNVDNGIFEALAERDIM